jgi:ribose transport system ATP-binding protein
MMLEKLREVAGGAKAQRLRDILDVHGLAEKRIDGRLESQGITVQTRTNAGLFAKQLVEAGAGQAGKVTARHGIELTGMLAQPRGGAADAIIQQVRDRPAPLASPVAMIDRGEDSLEIRPVDRATVFRDGRIIRTGAVSELEEADLIEAMVGHKLVSAVAGRRQASRSESKSGRAKFEPLLDVHFSHAERSHRLTLGRGEILGIAGFVGSGRTSLARAIIGYDHAMPVEVRLDGKAIIIRSPAEAASHGLVYITEDRKGEGLFGCLSVLANASAGSLNKLSYGGVINARAERRTGREILSQLRLKTRSLDAGVASLSGGNQQKVVFARGLLQHPRVLICDEPTRGVDVGAKEEIYQLLFALATRGIGIIVISSEFSEVLRLSDRTMVMRDGGFTGLFHRADADEHSLLAATSGSRS